jgi:hypothetical protein
MKVEELVELFKKEKFEEIEDLFVYENRKLIIKSMLSLIKHIKPFEPQYSPGFLIARENEEKLLVFIAPTSFINTLAFIIGEDDSGFWIEVVEGNKYWSLLSPEELSFVVRHQLEAGISLQSSIIKPPESAFSALLYRVQGDLNLNASMCNIYSSTNSVYESIRSLLYIQFSNQYFCLVADKDSETVHKFQVEVFDIVTCVLQGKDYKRYVRQNKYVVLQEFAEKMIEEAARLYENIKSFVENSLAKDIIKLNADNHTITGKGIIPVGVNSFIVLYEAEVIIESPHHKAIRVILESGDYELRKSGGLSINDIESRVKLENDSLERLYRIYKSNAEKASKKEMS